MLMLCVFYCIPFFKFLYFASSGILFVLALFMLKRGICTQRRGLRKAAFFLMFLMIFKTLVVDTRWREARRYLVCDAGLPLPCTGTGTMTLDAISLVLFVAASVVLFFFYRAYMPEKKQKPVMPEDIHLRLWSNLALWGVIAMIVWLAAPWVGFLTVGYLPKIFTMVSWKYFAIGNLVLLLYGFWKSESCSWDYKVKNKDKMKYLHNTWTPRDTLWTTAFMYLCTLALSYVSDDVLTRNG